MILGLCFSYSYVQQTKLASSLVNFWAHYNIVRLIDFDVRGSKVTGSCFTRVTGVISLQGYRSQIIRGHTSWGHRSPGILGLCHRVVGHAGMEIHCDSSMIVS